MSIFEGINVEMDILGLKETALYGKTEALRFSDTLWPDFTTPVGYIASDTLRKIYHSFFEDSNQAIDDYEKTLTILNTFAYPVIMGYASETGSMHNAILEYYTYSNYIMPDAFHKYKNIRHCAKLLYRLWRVKAELIFLPNWDIEKVKKNRNILLLFDETEVTTSSLKRYEKKLEKELKKIQKEIVKFRKSSLQ